MRERDGRSNQQCRSSDNESGNANARRRSEDSRSANSICSFAASPGLRVSASCFLLMLNNLFLDDDAFPDAALYYNGIALIQNSSHWRDETIANPGHSLDVVVIALILAQCLTQEKDVLREVRLFDEAIRPERCHQRAFLKHVSAVSTISRSISNAFGGSWTGCSSRSRRCSAASRRKGPNSKRLWAMDLS